MAIDWQALLQQLISTATLLAILGYVAKKTIETWLERDLEGM